MRALFVALALSCAGCVDFGIDIDPAFTEEERADIVAAVNAWEDATPAWRERVGAHMVHVRRTYTLPDPTWLGCTTPSTHTVLLLPKHAGAGPLFRRLTVHELGHVAGLPHVTDDRPTVMRHDVDTDTDNPTEADVIALRML